MSEYRLSAMDPDKIDELRFKAFETNNQEDKMAYYREASAYFQDRHVRALIRADIPTLSAAMELPEVRELIEALERAIEAIDAAYDGPDDNGNIAAALSTPAADTRVVVKPMVWEAYAQGEISRPNDVHPEYCTAPSVSKERAGEWRLRGPWIGFNYYPTKEAAKAAAQADYAARIRSALTVTPAPDAAKVAALVDAFEHLLNNYLLDEHDEPELCVDDEHWSAIHDAFAALAAIKEPKT